jgi:hypothetical protein
MLGCCGAPADWAGQEEKLELGLEIWKEDWQSLGGRPVVMACPSCREVLGRLLPEVEQVNLWEVLQETWTGARPEKTGPFAVHDPCTTRHDPGTRTAVRTLLDKSGVELTELRLGREMTECCGYGGLMDNANPDLAGEVIRRRGAQSPLDYLTYCAVCRDRLAAAGKRAVHALDLLFSDKPGKDPAERKGPGWSERRENRARLKNGLVRDLWGEEVGEMEAHRGLKLTMTPRVEELLEKRRILIEDLQRVIFQAEQSGQRLVHPRTGRLLAAFRPYKAMFWVEYSPLTDGFEVHNAYSHRMEVKAGEGSWRTKK